MGDGKRGGEKKKRWRDEGPSASAQSQQPKVKKQSHTVTIRNDSPKKVKRKVKKATGRPPYGLSEEVAVELLKAIQQELIDGEEDWIALFFDENDVPDEVEDKLTSHIEEILGAADQSAAINALAAKWGLSFEAAAAKPKTGKKKQKKKQSSADVGGGRSEQEITTASTVVQKGKKKLKKRWDAETFDRMSEQQGHTASKQIEGVGAVMEEVGLEASDDDGLEIGGLKLAPTKSKKRKQA